ncbi:hypothetical protein DL93DRAFT_414445 [Clavulina sp. PMI_390]|nr:hypothetical protein DL93DRAFT_414445 [Clavulina sp. PMI_390]
MRTPTTMQQTLTSTKMLTKGDACLPCRRDKRKCDGSKPACPRCLHLSKQCVYAHGIAQRRPTTRLKKLEARALELELTIRRLVLASAHDLSTTSGRLLKRIEHLGSYNAADPSKTSLPQYSTALKAPADSDEPPAPPFTGLEELPFPLANHLIHLFLPYRCFFFFFMNVSSFLQHLSLPPSHPESIHPCLLNACYLGACIVSKGSLNTHQHHFVRRTRHFLEQSLMFADRIPHFLCASMILGSHFIMSRRVEEAFAVISSAARLASACDFTREHNAVLDSGRIVLQPWRAEREVADCMELEYSIYIADQSLAIISGYPTTFAGDDLWGSMAELPQLQDQQRAVGSHL